MKIMQIIVVATILAFATGCTAKLKVPAPPGVKINAGGGGGGHCPPGQAKKGRC